MILKNMVILLLVSVKKRTLKTKKLSHKDMELLKPPLIYLILFQHYWRQMLL